MIGKVALLIPKHNDLFSDTFLLNGLGNPIFSLLLSCSLFLFLSTHCLCTNTPNFIFKTLACIRIPLPLVLYLSHICILKVGGCHLLSFWSAHPIDGWMCSQRCAMNNRTEFISFSIPAFTLTTPLPCVSLVSFITTLFTVSSSPETNSCYWAFTRIA